MSKNRLAAAADGSEMPVRDARKEDLPAILEIYNHEVMTSPATFDLEPQTMAQREEWFSEHQGRYR